MADTPSPKSKDQSTEPPAPEVLKPQADADTETPETAAPAATAAGKPPKRPRHGTYRPSHKATFIGLAVVIAILAINAGVIVFVVKSQSKAKTDTQGQVTVNQAALDKLGVNRAAVGDAGIQLTVNPDAKFNGQVQVGGDMTIAGQLKLNGTFSAATASFTKLQAGDTALSSLNVNADGTLSNVNVRKDLTVAGTSRLQGPVETSNLLTAAGINVTGNLSVGGVLSVNAFHSSNLVVDGTVTVGGHITTRGSAPRVGGGSALGSSGTVSISGNDMSGTVAVNIGVGASSGVLANVSFQSQYSNTPHVIVTAIGRDAGSFYINRSASGFSIVVSGALAPGGYAFDYIVEQ